MNVNQALSTILREGVDIHRCAAAQALGEIGDAEAVDTLIEALLDEDEDVRTDAAEALLAIGDKKAAPQLLENLIGDPCFEVKMAAVQALTKMGHQDAVLWIKRLLVQHHEEINWDLEEFYQDGWDSWVDLQVEAIKSLSAMGVEDAVPEIVTAIEDELGQDLTEVAFDCLGQLGKPGIEALIQFLEDPESRRRRRAVFVLAGLPDADAQEAVQAAIKDSAKDVRLSVIRALTENEAADNTLALFLADPDAEVRTLAVLSIGAGSAARLLDLLEDPSPQVQAAALSKLKTFPDQLAKEGAEEWLNEIVETGDPAVASQAAEALAIGFIDSAKPKLVEVLQDQEKPEEVRLGALRGLSSKADGSILQAIAAILGDENRQLRLEALSQLAKNAGPKKDFAIEAESVLIDALNGGIVPVPETGDDEDQPEIIHDTAELDDLAEAEEPVDDGDLPEDSMGESMDAPDYEGEEPTVEDADEAYPTSTFAAIMGDNGPKEGRAAMLGNTKDNRIRLTQSDMELLALSSRTPRKGRVNLSREIPAHRDVPQYAARVMGDVASESVASALAAHVESKNEQLRNAALDSLARIGETAGHLPKDAVQGLMRVVANAERDARLLAVRAIGYSGEKDCAGFLQHRLTDGDSFVKTEAIQALTRLGAEIDSLDELMESHERSVRLAAAEAHANVINCDSVDKLLNFAFANEGYHRRDAGRFLRKVNVEAANDRLVEVLQDENRRREWPVAIEALAEINMT